MSLIDYRSAFPKTSDIDFTGAFNTDNPVNFDAVGETVFPTADRDWETLQAVRPLVS